MTLKSDRWIREMAREHGMIAPFEDAQVRQGTISYGVSSYGYDMRVAREFKIFTNVNNAIVDPKNFDDASFVNFEGDVCIVPPNSFALARSVEYFKIPRNVLTLCVGKSTYARCFSGDTRVALADGTSATLEDMARRAESGEMLWGYAMGPFGRIMVALLEAPRLIGRDSLLEVVLDNGEPIRCTPDHEFILRDGRQAQAAGLRPGDSLMPLYRHLARGYESVYQPVNGHMDPTHGLADEWNVRNGVYDAVAGTHRHHRDGDRRNNLPWNIERMSASDHIRLHGPATYGEDFDPAEHGASSRESLARRAEDFDWRENQSRVQSGRARRFWSEEAYADARRRLVERHLENWTPERKEHQSATMRAFFSDPDNRAATGDRSRAAREQASVERRFPGVVSRPGRRPRAETPLNHKVVSVKPVPGDHDVYCLSVPEAGNFALAAGVFVKNCGIITNVTPFEPEWEGFVTLEISNTTPLPARIYANEGIAQVIFFESDEPCEVSYADRKGKYQGQVGVTVPRL